MIPISLKVTMDVIKYAYSVIIEWDIHMYYAPTDTPTTVNKYSPPPFLRSPLQQKKNRYFYPIIALIIF